MNKYLLAKDTINGASGNIYVTIDGNVYQAAAMRNVRADVEMQTADMRVIGTVKIQQKPTGTRMTGSGNIYYGTNIWTDMVMEYMKTGKMPTFTLQITNDDPTASVGRQTMTLYNCMLTGTIPLAVLNSEEAMMNYDFNFTYTNAERMEAFTDPAQYGSD